MSKHIDKYSYWLLAKLEFRNVRIQAKHCKHGSASVSISNGSTIQRCTKVISCIRGVKLQIIFLFPDWRYERFRGSLTIVHMVPVRRRGFSA